MKNKRIPINLSSICSGLYLIGIIFLLGSCKKFVEADLPIDKYPVSQVYEKTETAVLVMNGIFANLVDNTNLLGGANGISIQSALLADEVMPIQNSQSNANYINSLNGSSDNTIRIWNNSYRTIIYGVNSLMDGVSASKSLPAGTKQVLTGEAKFVRALTYFYLMNLYGDVPLVLTTDFTVNSTIPRTSQSQVAEQIIKDLVEAEAALPDSWIGTDLITAVSERIRPTKAAATALLARMYLYTGQWKKAEEEASKVISNSSTFQLLPLNDVFLKNSLETIWQLQPNSQKPNDKNCPDARFYLSGFVGFRFAVSNFLFDAFEIGDLRQTAWLTGPITFQGNDYYFPYKYKIGSGDFPQNEYLMVLRLAEQYLIRAEARAHQDKIAGGGSAAEDLDVIRSRAGLSETTAQTQAEMLNAILHERRIELFSELGHRWLDLKRTGQIDDVMSEVAPAKTGTWASYKALFPIPVNEFSYNPALRGHQNPGYPEQ